MTDRDTDRPASTPPGVSPFAEFRARMRWRLALPLAIASAALAAGLGLWAEGGEPRTALVWTILFLISIAAIAPLWADEAKPGRLAESAIPYLIVAALFATFLCWRTPDPTGGAAVFMAAIAPPAGLLLAWLHRLRERPRKAKKRSG